MALTCWIIAALIWLAFISQLHTILNSSSSCTNLITYSSFYGETATHSHNRLIYHITLIYSYIERRC